MSGGTLTYFFFFLGVVMAVVVVAKARFLELVLGIVLVLVAVRAAADRVIRRMAGKVVRVAVSVGGAVRGGGKFLFS